MGSASRSRLSTPTVPEVLRTIARHSDIAKLAGEGGRALGAQDFNQRELYDLYHVRAFSNPYPLQASARKPVPNPLSELLVC